MLAMYVRRLSYTHSHVDLDVPVHQVLGIAHFGRTYKTREAHIQSHHYFQHKLSSQFSYRIYITSYRPSYQKASTISKAANTLRTLWIQNHMVSYRIAFGIIGSPLRSRTTGKICFALRLRWRLYYFFTATDWEKETSRFRNLQKHSCVLQANISSRQLRSCSSAWSWRHRSINIFCWLWVPPRRPNWTAQTAREGTCLNGLRSHMHSPRMKLQWRPLGRPSRWRLRRAKWRWLF